MRCHSTDVAVHASTTLLYAQMRRRRICGIRTVSRGTKSPPWCLMQLLVIAWFHRMSIITARRAVTIKDGLAVRVQLARTALCSILEEVVSCRSLEHDCTQHGGDEMWVCQSVPARWMAQPSCASREECSASKSQLLAPQHRISRLPPFNALTVDVVQKSCK